MWVVRSIAGISLVAILGLPHSPVHAGATQKKGTLAPDLPGTLAFSCTASDWSQVFCANGDRIVGDGRSYPGIGVPETGQGVFLRASNSELWLGFGAGLYGM